MTSTLKGARLLVPSTAPVRKTGCSRRSQAPCFLPTSRVFVRRSHLSAVVVGGGPAGVAAVGSLLEKASGRVAWVDPDFRGGRINRKYREVPSNTKVGLFLAYAQAFGPLRDVVEAAPKPSAVSRLEELPHDDTCSLHYAGDMVQMLTDGLVQHERLEAFSGRVTDATWDRGKSFWTVTVQDKAHNQQHRDAAMLVLCTGASPTTIPLPVPPGTPPPRLLDLDAALQPSTLAAALPAFASPSPDEPTTIAVIGTSHSAILVLMNLVQLAQDETTIPNRRPLRVRWFARSASLRYATYLPDGTIVRDNTGLKGRAAAFARAQLDGAALDTSPAGRVITRVDCGGGADRERDAFRRHLPGCAAVVQAVGFRRDALPRLRVRGLGPERAGVHGGEEGEEGGNADAEVQVDVEVEPCFDHDTGRFTDARTGDTIPGLYGAGIAFPERVVDPEGHVEYAVGLFKFVKFLKRVVPSWVAESCRR